MKTLTTSIKLVAVGLVGLVFAATPPTPSQSPKISEHQIADFWRAKANLVAAQAAFDAIVTDLHKTCGHDAMFGPDGHPSCGPDVPVAPPAKPETPNGK